nr:ribosome biogenesis protein BMS1 homolog [Tanacetum cinerariifolium]
MIDAAKFTDLALLLIDGCYGFEMETFEILNILQVHGFPKVLGVLTHLDKFKDVKKLKKTKQGLKHRFWTEIYDGAKLLYLSGLIHGKYVKCEIHNLARFISVMKFHPLSWRTTHTYVLVDRTDRDVGEVLVKSLQNTKYSVDEKLNSSFINIFSQKSNKPEEITNGDDEDHMKHARYLEPIEELETDGSDDERKKLSSIRVERGEKQSLEMRASLMHDQETRMRMRMEMMIILTTSRLHIRVLPMKRRKKMKMTQKKLSKGLDGDQVNTEDSSKFINFNKTKDWKNGETVESIRNRFVTGDWSKAARRGKSTEADSENDDDDAPVFERRLKKLALRAKFDAQYPSKFYLCFMIMHYFIVAVRIRRICSDLLMRSNMIIVT